MSSKAITKMQAIVVAAVIVVAAIAGGVYYYYTTLPTEPTTIELTVANISYQSDWFEEKIDLWNEEHPEIQVTYQPLADYYTEILGIFASTPEAVDIVRTNPGYLSPWVDAGWITDIGHLDGYTGILNQVEAARRFELLYNGKYYGLPSYTGYMAIMLYNERYLQLAGIDHPPTTLQEFVDQCLAIKDR